MKLLYMTADVGGCRFYRCELPGLEMHKAGHTVCVTGDVCVLPSGEITAAGDGRYAPDLHFDVVVMQRWMGSAAQRQVKRARAVGQVVINDVDDGFWDLPETHPAFKDVDPRRNPDSNRSHYKRAIAASTSVTVSTPYLGHQLAVLGAPVHVLRNAIDPERYEVQPVRDTTSPNLGWVGAIGFRAAGDLDEMARAVSAFMRKHPESRFVHVGTRSDDPMPISEALGIDPDQVITRPFCRTSDLPAQMHDIDVALAPLSGCAFNYSKSAIKAMEASAAGVPFIASRMPEYQWFSDDRAGMLASTPMEWMYCLQQLTDPDVRQALSLVGRARAEEESIQRRWGEWPEAYAA